MNHYSFFLYKFLSLPHGDSSLRVEKNGEDEGGHAGGGESQVGVADCEVSVHTASGSTVE